MLFENILSLKLGLIPKSFGLASPEATQVSKRQTRRRLLAGSGARVLLVSSQRHGTWLQNGHVATAKRNNHNNTS